MVEKSFRIQNSSGDHFAGDLRYVNSPHGKPLLIVCHGFTAHKDWGPFPFFGRRFAELGFNSIVFNFSHNGIGSNFTKFTEFDKFSRNTIGRELEDLRSLLDAVKSGGVGGLIGVDRIGVIGHSRGAGVAILCASLDQRIASVAGWSAISTFFRYTSHQKALWEKEGSLPVTIRSMQTKLRYGIEVLRDLEENRAKYDLVDAVRRLTVPLLLVHGDADVTVRPAEAQVLFQASDRSKSELIMLERTGHMYGVKSGSTKLNPTLEHITSISAQWFHRHLST